MGRGQQSEEKLKLGKLKAEMLATRREATAKIRSQIRQGTDSPWRKSAVRSQRSDEKPPSSRLRRARRTEDGRRWGRRDHETTGRRDCRTTGRNEVQRRTANGSSSSVSLSSSYERNFNLNFNFNLFLYGATRVQPAVMIGAYAPAT